MAKQTRKRTIRIKKQQTRTRTIRIPKELRRLSPEEHLKLGRSPSARLYVNAKVKNVNRRTKTYSRRQRDKRMRQPSKGPPRNERFHEIYRMVREKIETTLGAPRRRPNKMIHQMALEEAQFFNARIKMELAKAEDRHYDDLFDLLPDDQYKELRAILGSPE